MARHTARSQARLNGYQLQTEDDTLDVWCLDVLYRRVNAEQIVQRFLDVLVSSESS